MLIFLSSLPKFPTSHQVFHFPPQYFFSTTTFKSFSEILLVQKEMKAFPNKPFRDSNFPNFDITDLTQTTDFWYIICCSIKKLVTNRGIWYPYAQSTTHKLFSLCSILFIFHNRLSQWGLRFYETHSLPRYWLKS